MRDFYLFIHIFFERPFSLYLNRQLVRPRLLKVLVPPGSRFAFSQPPPSLLFTLADPSIPLRTWRNSPKSVGGKNGFGIIFFHSEFVLCLGCGIWCCNQAGAILPTNRTLASIGLDLGQIYCLKQHKPGWREGRRTGRRVWDEWIADKTSNRSYPVFCCFYPGWEAVNSFSFKIYAS